MPMDDLAKLRTLRRKALRQLKAAHQTLADISELDPDHQPQVSGPAYLVNEALSVLTRYGPVAPKWVLQSKMETDIWGMPLYWRHDTGWVDFEHATHYDEKLPALEGLWARA